MSQIKNNPHIHPQVRVQPNKYRNVPKQYMEIAEGMETQFINHMLGEMRKTVHTEKPDSNASKYYKSLMDYERSKIMAATDNGVGLKDVILDQIVPQHLKASANPDAVKMYQQQVGQVQGDTNE